MELIMSVLGNKDLGQNNFFQAVGVISGDVQFESTSASIKIGNNKYKLCFSKVGMFQQLKKAAKSNNIKRLVVYPILTHFPGQTAHKISFDVIGFRGSKENSNTTDLDKRLDDLEFKICGIWQYIPVCKTPCISVFRNFTDNLVATLGKCTAIEKALLTKTNHVPVNVYGSNLSFLPKAYRFIKPREGEKQNVYSPFFVSTKVRFDPQNDGFTFVELLCPPSTKSPKYIKLQKEEKAAAAKARLEKKRETSTDTAKTDVVFAPPIKPRKKAYTSPQKPILKKHLNVC
jgi:hypothetical protein